jgi:hypothetical protein
MLQVSGIVAISTKSTVEEVSSEHGVYFNFKVASPDPDSEDYTYYDASMFVPHKETDQWRKLLQGGNAFHLQMGHWVMQEYEGGKYPIPKLKIQRFYFKHMAVPYWYKKENKK